jgi:hypothetical protein
VPSCTPAVATLLSVSRGKPGGVYGAGTISDAAAELGHEHAPVAGRNFIAVGRLNLVARTPLRNVSLLLTLTVTGLAI